MRPSCHNTFSAVGTEVPRSAVMHKCGSIILRFLLQTELYRLLAGWVAAFHIPRLVVQGSRADVISVLTNSLLDSLVLHWLICILAIICSLHITPVLRREQGRTFRCLQPVYAARMLVSMPPSNAGCLLPRTGLALVLQDQPRASIPTVICSLYDTKIV